ncbi:gamma carbonic anhydrase family protein [Nonomuraea rubra]|nr:gamma carbonic anhydrase family protein [Nonomuraea rubra]
MSRMYIAALDNGAVPDIHPEAYIAPGAVVVGNVRVGRASSIWYGSVLRGDDERIEIGAECNVQDLSCLHSDPGEPAILEDRVSLGHKAMVHGAHVESGALIGIGAIVLGGARVGAGTLVAAGALVGPGKKIPAGVLVAGVPGKIVRELTDDDRDSFARTPDNYQAKALRHRQASSL